MVMQHNRILSNKNAIITGAASGIGRAAVKVFAENGANVWAFARKPDEEFENFLHELSSEYGCWIKPVYVDLTSEEDLKKAFMLIKKENLPIDCLINNAGASYDALLPMISKSRAMDLFQINFFAHMQLTQYVSRVMTRQKHGSIVFTGSYLGFDGNRGQMVYSATKAAVHGMTKSLSKELMDSGIRVNAVAPGVVQTKLLQTMTADEYKQAVNKSLMHRAADPEEIANMIMVLASDLSSYVTGQIVRVDGGMN